MWVKKLHNTPRFRKHPPKLCFPMDGSYLFDPYPNGFNKNKTFENPPFWGNMFLLNKPKIFQKKQNQMKKKTTSDPSPPPAWPLWKIPQRPHPWRTSSCSSGLWVARSSLRAEELTGISYPLGFLVTFLGKNGLGLLGTLNLHNHGFILLMDSCFNV